ncbi:MAG: hypothetical protein AAF585_12675, partial [Verrucomicrobiota bacterium]
MTRTLALTIAAGTTLALLAPPPSASAEGVVALGLKAKYEAAADSLEGRVARQRAKLESAYLARLDTIGSEAATRERARFEGARAVPAEPEPNAGEIADLQAVFRREASKL